jgi:hypothetical protein
MEFKVKSNPSWKEPLGSDVLIIDMDTRWPDGDNEVFGKGKLNWENVTGNEGGSMLTASVLNHFMYGELAVCEGLLVRGWASADIRSQPRFTATTTNFTAPSRWKGCTTRG